MFEPPDCPHLHVLSCLERLQVFGYGRGQTFQPQGPKAAKWKDQAYMTASIKHNRNPKFELRLNAPPNAQLRCSPRMLHEEDTDTQPPTQPLRTFPEDRKAKERKFIPSRNCGLLKLDGTVASAVRIILSTLIVPREHQHSSGRPPSPQKYTSTNLYILKRPKPNGASVPPLSLPFRYQKMEVGMRRFEYKLPL